MGRDRNISLTNLSARVSNALSDFAYDYPNEHRDLVAYIEQVLDNDRQMKEKLLEQNEILQRLQLEGLTPAVVIGFSEDLLTVKTLDGVYCVARPDFFVDIGGMVLMSVSQKQIYSSVDSESLCSVGPTATFIKHSPEAGLCFVESEGQRLTVYNRVLRGDEIKPGSTIMLDPTQSVILQDLGLEKKTFQLARDLMVEWDSIGGLEEVKREVRTTVIGHITNPARYESYGISIPKGYLLYGPPGCGKTLIARAVATEIWKLMNGQEDGSFEGYIYVKGPEVLDRWVGSAEARIRGLFAQARDFKEEHGFPAVLFIDEAEALLGKRGRGISSDMEKTIVPTFLAEMDGLDDSGAIVFLATNRHDVLDPAVVREKRIDRKIHISRPSADAVRDIFKIHLAGIPTKCSQDDLAQTAAEVLFSDKFKIYDIMVRGEKSLSFTLGHICSGALIEATVNHGALLTMMREQEDGTEGGMTSKDLLQALVDMFHQNKDFDHSDDLSAFVHNFKDDVTEIKKLTTSS